ncbi:MAG: hypothetical protein H6730_13245 [Deltaproteobacteria bacterium]|nr:hypothetical protein [Deltaproteobacteria bacterium]
MKIQDPRLRMPPRLDAKPVESLARGRPQLLDVLGDQGMAPVKAVRRDEGRVVWFNWALAEEMGLELPADRRMHAGFEEKLLSQLNLEVLPEGKDPEGREVVTGYADYYGGSGIGYNQGSGRAAFFGDLNAKGVGAIREMLSELTSYDHRHGGMSFTEGGVEAVLGEVNRNLFARGSTRILAVLDRGDYIAWEDTGTERRAVAYRAGNQTRPAHLMARQNQGKELEILLRMLDQTGDLVQGRDGKVDLGASVERLVKAHAKVAAEQYRYRILHGALSPSNTEVDGTFLDLATETPQPRTAPVRVLERGYQNANYTFDTEKQRRIDHLKSMVELVQPGLRKAKDKVSYRPVNVAKVFELAYAKEQQIQLMGATGLSPALSRKVAAAKPEVAERFARALTRMAAELHANRDLSMDKKVVSDVSVADVFGALAQVPKAFFLHPGQDLVPVMREALALNLPEGERRRGQIEGQIAELAAAYKEVLAQGRAAHLRAGGSEHGFERAVIHRAAFENRPMDALYRTNLRWSLIEATNSYEATGDADAFQRTVDRVITHSIRDVDALKQLGSARALEDGTRVLQERTVRGVHYGVVSPTEGAPSVRVSVPVEHLEHGRVRLPTLDNAELSAEQVQSMGYLYTLDGWQTQDWAPAVVGDGELVFEVPSFSSQAAVLEGLFHVEHGDFWLKDRTSNFEGYVFAVPDEGER